MFYIILFKSYIRQVYDMKIKKVYLKEVVNQFAFVFYTWTLYATRIHKYFHTLNFLLKLLRILFYL